MSTSGKKPRLSPPLDERGLPINLEITQENSFRLHLMHYPDFSFVLLGFIISLVFTVMLIYFRTAYALASALFLLLSIYELFVRRSIRCVIDNKQD